MELGWDGMRRNSIPIAEKTIELKANRALQVLEGTIEELQNLLEKEEGKEESAMKNNECIIKLTTKHGHKQSYHKEKNGWTQTSPNGKVRPLSAEQLLSHILPSLAGIGHLNMRVELVKGVKK